LFQLVAIAAVALGQETKQDSAAAPVAAAPVEDAGAESDLEGSENRYYGGRYGGYGGYGGYHRPHYGGYGGYGGYRPYGGYGYYG